MLDIDEARPGEVAKQEDALLKVQDLSVRFSTPRGTIVAVDGLSYELASGEVLAVIGESGSGKSVSAETLLGLNRDADCVTEGAVLLRGRDVLQAGRKEIERIRGREIALVFQDPTAALNPALTVGFQMCEVFRTRLGASRAEARERSIEMLDRVGLRSPAERMNDYPYQLSGGMRQRVMIGIAISLEPAILIADEATTALDVTIQAEVLRLLDRLREETQMAMLFISHDLAVASDIADRIAVMYAGKLVETGSTRSIFRDPRHPYTRALLAATPTTEQVGGRFSPVGGAPPDPLTRVPGCVFHPRCPHVVDECRTVVPQLVPLRGGRMAACHRVDDLTQMASRVVHVPTAPRRVPSEGAEAPLVSARDLRREFKLSNPIFGPGTSMTAVAGVSLDMYPQETLALVGESGSGKSTVARMIGRLLEPTSGVVELNGTDIWSVKGSRVRELRRHIQMIFQDPLGSLDPRMSIGDAIREPWVVNRFGLSKKEQRLRVAGLLEDVGLQENDASRRPAEFSGGQRQRVAIARALAMNPSVLICDEPVSALDVSVQAQILNLLRRLQDEHSISYLFISHDLAVVRNLAHRVAVMQTGEIVEAGPVGDVYESPQHPYTQKLIAAIPGRQSPQAAGDAA